MSGPNFFKFQSMFILATRCNRRQKTFSIPKCSLDYYVWDLIDAKTRYSSVFSVILQIRENPTSH